MRTATKISREDRLKLTVQEIAFLHLRQLIEGTRISLLAELNEILIKTKNHEIRDSVAKILFCIKDKRSLKFLIQAIKKKATEGYRGYLVLCCEAFDCSPYLLFFVELALNENSYTSSNAMMIVKKMKGPFKKGDHKIALHKLKALARDNRKKMEIAKELYDHLLARQSSMGNKVLKA